MVRISLSDEQIAAILRGERAELVDSRGEVVAREVDLDLDPAKCLPEMLTTDEAKTVFERLTREKRTACE